MENKVNDLDLAKVIRKLRNYERQYLPQWVIDHEKEVAVISYRMGELLGLSATQLAVLAIAARFHDIGKSKIDRNIVDRDGELGVGEIQEILDHVDFSYDVLKENGISWQLVLQAVLLHHENFDGTGYPYGLKGKDISVEAQILRVVDSFSAMHGSRPYPNSYGEDVTVSIQEIKDKKEIFYNPEVVEVFLELVSCSRDKPERIYERPKMQIEEVLYHCGIQSGNFFTIIRNLARTLRGSLPLEPVV
ncbi:MAG: HD domain-containing protein [PVC group bacterium]|nr:HD domain-containing protein [PVC group bacterium]